MCYCKWWNNPDFFKAFNNLSWQEKAVNNYFIPIVFFQKKLPHLRRQFLFLVRPAWATTWW